MNNKQKACFFNVLLAGGSIEEIMDETKLDKTPVLDILGMMKRGIETILGDHFQQEAVVEADEDQTSVVKNLMESYDLDEATSISLFKRASELFPNKGAAELFIGASLLHNNKANITNSPQGVKLMTRDLSALLDP